jgi:hypothetical protein
LSSKITFASSAPAAVSASIGSDGRTNPASTLFNAVSSNHGNETVSLPARVPMADQTVEDTLLVIKWTEPSQKAAFTPPMWRLRAELYMKQP